MNSTTQNTLTEGKLAPALLRFAVPFLISNFSQKHISEPNIIGII